MQKSETIFGVSDLAKQLGVSKKTICRRITRREIPAPEKVGTSFVWRACDVAHLLPKKT